MIKIYTDGAYSSLRDMGGYAFVVLRDEEKVYSYFFNEPNTTNNRMEIQAVISALNWLYENNYAEEEIAIYTDSMYVIGSMTKNWKRNKNVELFSELDNVFLKFKNVIFKHVKGHSGDKYNELCDKLAVIASQSK
jgi:ribonuclease HI